MEDNRVLNQLYNNLMQVPHREYGPLVAAFRGALNDHPMFASHAAVYTYLNTKIRDQADCATIAMLQADPSYPEYREAGRVMLLGNAVYQTAPYAVSGLEPYRIFRIEQFIRKSDRKVPRLMKSIMIDYLTAIQENQDWFDALVVLNRSDVKSAYFHYHVPMNDLAKAVFIDNQPPEGTKLNAIKQIANESDPNVQARLLVQHKIPYKIAPSLLGGLTPVTGVALINAMSPTEALNSRNWVENSGLLNIPEVRDLYVAKIGKATKSVASADYRKSAQGSNAEVQAAVNQAREKSVAQEKRIGGQTDIYMDISISMDHVIRETPRFAERIWPLCDDPVLIAHNTSAFEIKVENTGNPLQDVSRALRGMRASGGTLMGCALNKSRQMGRNPQRIVFLTDGEENRSDFVFNLGRYVAETGVTPQLVIILFRSGRNGDTLHNDIRHAGYEVEQLEFAGDYYIFDQVAALLGGDVPKSFVERIMDVDLPYRVK